MVLNKGFLAGMAGLVALLTLSSSVLFYHMGKRSTASTTEHDLYKENTELREKLKALLEDLDEVYAMHARVASALGIQVYPLSSKNLHVGATINDVDIDRIETYLLYQKRLLKELELKAEENRERLKRLPSIMPAAGVIVSGFGVRRDPITGGLRFHKGLDISAPRGTPVVATADGRVVVAGYKGNGYGKQVVIDHGYGLKTRYAHLSKVLVAEGQEVKRGELIGLMGSTGRSVGPHLHYEVLLNGNAVNPRRFILFNHED